VSARNLWPTLASVGHELGYVDCDGVRTRYLLAGPREAPPLVFLHGFGSQIETFLRNIGPHAERRRVLALDMLGHGFTDAPDRPYEIDDYLAHLATARRALGVGRCDLVGVALGAWVAARCAARRPDEVSRLTLVAPGGMTSNLAAMEAVRRISLAAAQAPSTDTVRDRLTAVLADPNEAVGDLVETRLEMALQPDAEQAMRNILCLHEPEGRARNLLEADELARIACPTLVVSGGADKISPPVAGQAFAEAIPGARQIVLEGGGHWVHFEQADAFNVAHLRFLAEES
jgi:2-hydroxy-6-oxonona-2,4-dienedioate hydrolase